LEEPDRDLSNPSGLLGDRAGDSPLQREQQCQAHGVEQETDRADRCVTEQRGGGEREPDTDAGKGQDRRRDERVGLELPFYETGQ
jgi:hypothetical protein